MANSIVGLGRYSTIVAVCYLYLTDDIRKCSKANSGVLHSKYLFICSCQSHATRSPQGDFTLIMTMMIRDAYLFMHFVLIRPTRPIHIVRYQTYLLN